MRKFLSLFLALAMSIACCTLAAAEDTAEAMQYTEENITIDAGDHQIPATLTVPVGAEGEKFPAVVMLHGNGSTRHEAGNAYDYAAQAMAKAGIATIRFDYIGNGDSTSDYIDFTYDKGVEDAMKCYEYLKTLGTIDMDHTHMIHVAGHHRHGSCGCDGLEPGRPSGAADGCAQRGVHLRADVGRRLRSEGQ